MKVVVSDWAWFSKRDLTERKMFQLRDMLTIIPKRTSIHQKEVVPLEMFRETISKFGIPREYFIENRQLNHKIVYDMSEGRDLNLVFNGEYINDQGAAVKRVVSDYKSLGTGGIIEAKPGWGKTITALGILSELNKTAVIVVNKSFLLEQWIKRIKAFLPDARVGVIQGDKCQFGDDYDISIAMVQSLAQRRDSYSQELWEWPGIVCTDEVHRFGAKTWASVVPMFKSRYRIGLSATLKRKDGTENTFFWHIGNVLYRSKVSRMVPKLRRVFTGFDFFTSDTVDPHKFSDATKLNLLCGSKKRNRLIVDELIKASNVGRKIIALSARRKHLEKLRMLFSQKKREECSVDFYVGGMTQTELDMAENADVIFSCVTDDVECLTDNGWRKNSDLVVGDMVASYNIKRGVIEFVPLEKICIHDYDSDVHGKLFSFKRKAMSVSMTCNHRNVVSGEKEDVFKKAFELVSRDKIRTMAKIEIKPVNSIGVHMAELMGWIIAEGSYHSEYSQVFIYQDEGTFGQKRIDFLLNKLGFGFGRNSSNGSVQWSVHAAPSKLIRKYSSDKKLNKFLSYLPEDQTKSLFNGLVWGDGNIREEGRTVFVQKDFDTVNWFCFISMRLGYRPMVGYGGGSYRVYLTNRHHVLVGDKNKTISMVSYKGRVWCPVTKNKTWVARSSRGENKYSIFLTGNTYQMAKEALDIPGLDTLFLLTPENDVEQASGRISRPMPDKKEPIVVDFIDNNIPTYRNRWKARLAFYKRNGMFVKEEGKNEK